MLKPSPSYPQCMLDFDKVGFIPDQKKKEKTSTSASHKYVSYTWPRAGHWSESRCECVKTNEYEGRCCWQKYAS